MEELNQIIDFITTNTFFCAEEVLTSDEADLYMGFSKSYLYKLTMRGEIPYFEPLGKMCYFNRVEPGQWLQRNHVVTREEIKQRAQNYRMRKGGVL